MASSSGSSRQKSCHACVKGKRRCDKKMPSCGRCVKKRHACIYASQTDLPPFDDSADAAVAVDAFTDPTSPSSGDDFMLDPTSFSASIEANLGLSPSTTFQFDSAFSVLMGNVPHVGLNDSSWHSPPHLLSTQPQMPLVLAPAPAEKALTVTDYSKMSQMCEDYAPWQLADPSTKIAFTMNVFKKVHIGFARNNCTAFLHRYLYKDNMPRCILQAFSMCLLYTNQTEANRGPLLRILHTNVTELKETTSGTSLTPQEKLARVHALLFYQTIRMFDGDITLGQEADDDMALLESWNTELCKMRDNLDEFVTMDQDDVRNKPPESWERWIFAESLRKTCVIGFSLRTFWDLLKRRSGYDDVGNWAYVHRWTLSSHLWDASSSFDFFRAWKEKPMWVISAFKFEDFLKSGVGDDIDEFSLYFLTM
ncbi:hypothetical protein F4775DRAFT_582465 [Biscogniauxia sp. FL1348]|nr:hypothetical protein F4775DRAFT_582465 [Biscogniauxia sp. FL1348]